MVDIKKTVIYIIAATIVLAFTVGSLYISGVFGPRFFPTFEQAFANHSGGHRNFGEIHFVHEHEDTLIVFHISGGLTRVSHVSYYLLERREGEVWFTCIAVATGIWGIEPEPDSIRSAQLNIVGRTGGIYERMFEEFGRRPFYGFSTNTKIHNLTINGQPVDYVVDRGLNTRGEQRYLWFFSDLQILHIPNLQADDIVISFE